MTPLETNYEGPFMENRNSIGAEDFLKAKDIKVVELDEVECFKLMQAFVARSSDPWREDIAS
jgi:hypothetical protein